MTEMPADEGDRRTGLEGKANDEMAKLVGRDDRERRLDQLVAA